MRWIFHWQPMTVDIASLAIRVDSLEARTATADLDKLRASGEKTEKGTSALTSAFGVMAKALAALKVLDLIRDSALLAARFQTMGVVMGVAGNNAGYTRKEMAALEVQMQKTGISMVKTREILTTMATANIDLSKATALARASQDLAVVGNMNSSEAMARLIHGIQSGEVEILRGIGLNVNFEGSYKKLASQLHTTSDKLTDQQKVMARTNIVLQESTKYTGIYEESMTTAGKALNSLDRYWEDLKVKAGEAFLPALSDAVFKLTDALKAANSEMDNFGKDNTMLDLGANIAKAFTVIYQTLAILVANFIFTFSVIAKELAGFVAGIQALATGNLAGAKAISASVEEETGRMRRALDAYEAKILGVGETSKTMSEEEIAAMSAAATIKEANAIAAGRRAREAQDLENKRLKEAEKALALQKKYDEQYKGLIKSISEKTAETQLDMVTQGKLTEGQKFAIKVLDDLRTGELKLSDAKKLKLAAGLEEMLLMERIRNAEDADRKAAETAYQTEIEATNAIWNNVRAMDVQIATFGMSAAQVTLYQRGLEAAKLSNAELTAVQRSQIEQRVAGLDALAARQGKLTMLDSGTSVAKAKELLDIMSAIDDATRNAAAGMAASFGHVGAAIGGLTTALSGYGKAQAIIAAQLAAAMEKDKTDPVKIEKAKAVAAAQSAQAQVKSYGDMAHAAKGFFKENTTGYKLMEGAEKAFRAAEMAMSIQAMIKKIFYKEGEVAANLSLNATKLTGEAASTAASSSLAATEASAWGVTAVVKALASLPFPLNLAAGAATLAAVIAVGAKIMGSIGGGGSGGGKSAADMQKEQGTGTVFGDTKAKSDSIQNTLELLEGNSNRLIPINREMLSALRSIQASMAGLTNLLVRTPGIVDASNMGIKQGTISKSTGASIASGAAMGATAGAYFGPIGMIIGGIGGAIIGAVTSLWGKTKQSIVDSGIQIGGSVRALQQGQGYNQYASVDTTKSSWFGLSKKTTNSIQTQGLGDELANQFGMIFTNLEGALTAAAVGLGVGADHVKRTLDALTIEVTSISLKGLSGDDLTQALNGVISKAMDEMASAVFPQMEAFRQVGEGYAETVMRVANNYASLDVAMQSIGTTFGAAGMSSLAAREHLIGLAGGIDKLTEQVAGFAENYLTEAARLAPVQAFVIEEMAALGLAHVTTRDQFRDTVLSIDKTTEAGAAQWTSMMALQEAFAKVTSVIEEVGTAMMSVGDIFSQQKELQQRLNEVTMTAAQLEAQRRDAIHESNLALYDSVIAAESLASANAELERKAQEESAARWANLSAERQARESAEASAAKGLLDQRTSMEAQYFNLTHTAAEQMAEGRRKEIDAMHETLRPLQMQINAQKDLAAAAEASARRIEAIASESAGIARSMMQLTGDTAGLRKLELEATAVENRAAKQAFFNMQDKIATEQAAAQAAAEAAQAAAEQQRAVAQAAEEQKRAAEQLKSAWQGVTNSIFDEVARIRGLLDGGGSLSLAGAQSKFAITTAQARAGDQDAAKLLPQLSQSMLTLAEANAATSFDLRLIRAQTAASLTQTGSMLGSQFGLSIPSYDVGTDFVPRTGLALIHEGERITPAAYNRPFTPSRSGGDTKALEAAVDRLTAQVAELQRTNTNGQIAIINKTDEVANHLDGAINGERPILVEVAA